MKRPKFAVLTDSASDIPPELAEKQGVDILSLKINVDGKSYVERDDFTFEEFYEILRTCQKVPTTSQVTMFEFLEQFEKYEKEKVEEVLYVSINSTGSATHDAAVLASQNFQEKHPGSGMKIWIVDSHTYSMSYGYFVTEAAAKLRSGAEMRDVVEWLNDVFSRAEIILGAYTLKFLKKSGRVNAAAAFAGELLGLRPIISLTNGISAVESKVRGDAAVMPALIEYADKRMDDTKQYMVAGADKKQIEELAALCRKKWKAEPLVSFWVGAAVAVNTGPDVSAVVFLGEKRV